MSELICPENFQESVLKQSQRCDGRLIYQYQEGEVPAVTSLTENVLLDMVNDTLQPLIKVVNDDGGQDQSVENLWIELRNEAQLALVLRDSDFDKQPFYESVFEQSQKCDQLLVDKQKDYGPKNITMFGEYGVLVRSNDKIQRLINLTGNEKDPQNEPITDSWRDLRNYGQIALMLRNDEFEFPLTDVEMIDHGSYCLDEVDPGVESLNE